MDPQHAHSGLEAIVGPENILDSDEASDQRIGGCSPAVAAVFPASVEEVQEVVRFCRQSSLSVIPRGSGTMAWRSAFPTSFDVAVSTTRLNRVIEYQRENLVFAAEPGVTGAAATAELSPHRQMIAVDCPRFAEATLGGVAATRASGPSRIAYGTPRDLVVGVKVVNGEGEIIKGGGRVVKNVSGYDMCRLYTGSLGTLGILVEVAFRLHPLPRRSAGLCAAFSGWSAADTAVAAIMDSSLLPRMVEFCNQPAAQDAELPVQAPVVACIISDGTAEQVDYQTRVLQDMLEQAQAAEIAPIEAPWHSSIAQKMTDAEYPDSVGGLFVINGLPSDVPAMADALSGAGDSIRILITAPAGVVRVCVPDCSSAEFAAIAAKVRERLSQIPGVQAAAFHTEGSHSSETYLSQPPGVEIMRRIKQNLDPAGVFPSGRYWGGI